MSRLIPYPERLPNFNLPVARAERNAAVTFESQYTQTDILYILAELLKKVGADDLGDATSHEYRIRSINDRLTALEAQVATLTELITASVAGWPDPVGIPSRVALDTEVSTPYEVLQALAQVILDLKTLRHFST